MDDNSTDGLLIDTMKGMVWPVLAQNKYSINVNYCLFLEKEMATHSSTLAWEIPWKKEPGRLQSMGSQRVGHN